MNILFLSPIVPYPLVDGDHQRAFHMLRLLARKHRVHLLCFQGPREDPAGLNYLKRFCASVAAEPITRIQLYWNALRTWPTSLPLNVGAYHSPGMQRRVQESARRYGIQAVHAYRLRMAPYALALTDCWRVLDYTDSLSRYMQHRLEIPGRPGWERMVLRHEAKRLHAYEVEVSKQFDRCLISSPKDRDDLVRQGARRILEVATNGVDTASCKPRRSLNRTPNVIFVGNMRYPPNHQGLEWFCRLVWPRVQAEVPNARLKVVGQTPASPASAWARQYPGAEFQGVVKQVLPYLHHARVGISPLQVASGRQFKVIEYFSAGVPTVATSVVAENLHASAGRHLRVADSAERFAAEVIRLCQDDRLANRLRQAGRQLAQRQYDWALAGKILSNMYSLRRQR